MVHLVRKEGVGENKEVWFFDFSFNGSQVGGLRLEFTDSICNLHLEIEKWSHNSFKAAVEDWNYIVLPEIVKSGCNKILVTYSKSFGNIEGWKKLINRFGFPEPETVYLSTRKV